MISAQQDLGTTGSDDLGNGGHDPRKDLRNPVDNFSMLRNSGVRPPCGGASGKEEREKERSEMSWLGWLWHKDDDDDEWDCDNNDGWDDDDCDDDDNDHWDDDNH